MRTQRFFTIIATLWCCASVALAQAPEGYYSAAAGKKKADLKAALHDIIRTASVLNYGSGSGATWSGFYQTDRTDDGYCIDRYSAEQRQFTSTTSAPSGMNIEHSFAKSWWGGSKNQAYCDLFNLMPSDSKANSAKSNYPMGVVTSTTWQNGSIVIGNSNDTNVKVWEPEDKWKGDFARTYMYMVTCYSDLTWTSNGLNQLDNNQWPTFNAWTQEMVLEWSRQDPVDDIERQRNEAVYEIQGNRNPFVDFPHLCEYVWGDSIAYAFYPDKSTTNPGTGGEGGSGDVEDGTSETVLDAPLTDGLGVFTDILPSGEQGSLWRSNASYGAVANAYSNGAQVADNYLVAKIDLRGYTDATLSFVHQTGFNKSIEVGGTYFQVLVADDYYGVPEDASWESLDVNFPTPPSSGWTSAEESGDISLKRYAGSMVTLAFRYTSTTSACYGWEIRDVLVTGFVSTGITDVIDSNAGAAEGHSYDLTGRRVRANQAKGLIVVDGRLVVK